MRDRQRERVREILRDRKGDRESERVCVCERHRGRGIDIESDCERE